MGTTCSQFPYHHLSHSFQYQLLYFETPWHCSRFVPDILPFSSIAFLWVISSFPFNYHLSPCCCCFLVIQLCLTLCDPMDCITPGLPVVHHLEFAQVHAHCISDAIQPSHPLSPSSPSAFHLSIVYSPTKWCHSCFQVSANTNKTAFNIHVQVSVSA